MSDEGRETMQQELMDLEVLLTQHPETAVRGRRLGVLYGPSAW